MQLSSVLRPSTRGRRRSLVGVLASAALVAALVSAPTSAQAESRDFGRSTTVGQAPGNALPTVRRAVSAQALAAISCRSVEAFSRTTDGLLYRLVDTAPGSGATETMSEVGQVGSGWYDSAFAWVAAGGDGVVYALTWSGDLKWYRYVNGWQKGTGTRVGSGFTPRTRIKNIALGGDGNFYVVRTDGKLVLYRHTGRLAGTASWVNGSGWVIGTGWTDNEILIPNGDGTLYRQYLGALYWYRHTDPAAGGVTWSPRRTIGSGWNFYDVLSVGGGVLYATQGDSGDVLVYRHGDPQGGSVSWAASRGVLKTTVRDNSYGIAADPLACRLA